MSGGKRADLGGKYYRSTWEANYARYLRWREQRGEIASWAHEPFEFRFPGITRGTMTYLPDFRVAYADGRHEWHEVKGYMDAQSKTRLARMAKHFPDERVLVIDAKWFARARTMLAHVVPGWERGAARAPARGRGRR